MPPGAYEPAEEHIIYVMRVITSKNKPRCTGSNEIPNMVLTARPYGVAVNRSGVVYFSIGRTYALLWQLMSTWCHVSYMYMYTGICIGIWVGGVVFICIFG